MPSRCVRRAAVPRAARPFPAVVPADTLIPVGDDIGLHEAAALYRYGATAQGLIRAGRVTAGDRVLVQAAAGAVGKTLLIP